LTTRPSWGEETEETSFVPSPSEMGQLLKPCGWGEAQAQNYGELLWQQVKEWCVCP